MKITKNQIIGGIAVLAIAAVAAFNVNLSMKDTSKNLSTLAKANLEALAQESGGNTGEGGLDTSYNRNPFQCTIYGNGKVKLVGGSIIQINGSLSFDGGIYCTSGGNATCSPIECATLWQWIF
jgi:hypothetical protein